MFTEHQLREDERLDGLLNAASRRYESLIFNKVSIYICWDERLRGGNYGYIQPSTDVEKIRAEIDCKVMLNPDIEDWDDKDIEAAISQMIGCIEATYRGAEDTPTIIIIDNYVKINPEVVQYYGKDTRIYSETFKDAEKKSNHVYPEKEEKKGAFGIYKRR